MSQWTPKRKPTKAQKKRRGKYRSILEKDVAAAFEKMEIGEVRYEPFLIPYIVPTERHTYKPDFVPAEDDDVIIEAKGMLTAKDRKKMLLLKEQHPNKRFLLLFGNARSKIYKGSMTTCADWAESKGFEWGDFYRSGIPEEWFE